MADDQLTAEDRLRNREERRTRFRAAALDAERDTGRRERTDEEARRNIVVRIAIIAFGTLVTLTGLCMLVLPGPGIVIVIAGLGILASEVRWAERLLAYAKKKANVESITAQHPWIKPVSIVLMVLGVAASIIYTVRWR
ncbi:MAG TPA: PGPGW domain-containing protein [Iamia sp.]